MKAASATAAATAPPLEPSKKSKKNGKKSPDLVAPEASASKTKVVNGDAREKTKTNGDLRDKELAILRKENEELRVSVARESVLLWFGSLYCPLI